MPFDSTNYVETHAEEIVILDKMAEILATPDKWCQRALLLIDKSSGEAAQFCTLGALHCATHGTTDPKVLWKQEWTDAAAHNIYSRMFQILGERSPGAFNDAETTTHQDILDLIAKTRESFS